ncbi:hypothetical protein SAMN05216260_11276 [Streptomyces griseoaurantiacus]|uniref:Uncharacterized protein n=3 Tax=Streptomyces griseoaurantiacus TaxID=68213 RepID=A0A1G7Q253_9ACTN|nr:hypothetical protein SAMN05216260_11276 [Streptomyces jietaisiensis]
MLSKGTPAAYSDAMTGTPFSPRMSQAETSALVTDAADRLVHTLADRVLRPQPGPEDEAGADRARALARLHVLANLEQAVHHLQYGAARAAAAAGAGYPQIGDASNMSRQGARRRWPGLVTNAMPHSPTRTITRSS